MRRATITTAAVLILLMAACSSGDDDTQPPTTTSTVDAAAAAGIPPKPDQATVDAYIAALDAINPAIVHRPGGQDEAGDIEQAINRGRDQCSTITGTADRARQVETTNMRFTSPDAPEGWGPEIAERILDVVHQHLCPDA